MPIDPFAEQELCADNAAAVARLLADAEAVREKWREEGKTREALVEEFGEVLGAAAPTDRDWPVEIVREHYMDGPE